MQNGEALFLNHEDLRDCPQVREIPTFSKFKQKAYDQIQQATTVLYQAPWGDTYVIKNKYGGIGRVSIND